MRATSTDTDDDCDDDGPTTTPRIGATSASSRPQPMVTWRDGATRPFAGSKSNQPWSGSHTVHHACDASAPIVFGSPGGGSVSI